MKNTLPFWTLQHLYVILSLTDVREIEDITAISTVFGILHPEVERMEGVQAELGERVNPLIQQKNGLAQMLKDREAENKKANDIIDRQEALDTKLKELDTELQEIQGIIPEFEWTPAAVEMIRAAVIEVFRTLGTQHDRLSGYRRIKATADIIQFFEIPVSVSL